MDEHAISSPLRWFPEGTTVGAYPKFSWPGGNVRTDAPPPGAPSDEQVVTNGELIFDTTNFIARGNQWYYAYAEVEGEHRYLGFAPFHLFEREFRPVPE